MNENLFTTLKVKVISQMIFNTDLGKLEKNWRKGENDYYYTLDSVILDKETSKKLDDLLK